MTIIFLQANVDFVSTLPLEDVGRLIAARCFGGGEFCGEDEGIWDEVPAVRLDREVLGLEIILGGTPGNDGGYTLEVASKEPLGGEFPDDPVKSCEAVCEFSRYLSQLVNTIPELEVQLPSF